MKRFISLTLLAVFLFNIGGYFVLYSVIKSEIREEMERELEHETLSVLTLNEHDRDIHWLDAKEFDYHGKRYDVAKLVHQDGQLIIYCLEDSHEERLVGGLEEHHKREISGDSKDPKPTKKNGYKKTLQLLVEDQTSLIFTNSRLPEKTFVFLALTPTDADSSVPAPPPDLV